MSSDRPVNRNGQPLTPVVLNTNLGGVSTYLCGCGAFIHWELWERHQQTCPADEPVRVRW